MGTREQRLANLWDVVAGGTILMLLVIVLDLYAVEMLKLFGAQGLLDLSFRLKFFFIFYIFASLVVYFYTRRVLSSS